MMKNNVQFEELGYKEIVLHWFPLGISNTLMNVELPLITAIVARGSNPSLNIAALGIAWSIAVAMESPIMMILPTAVKMAGNPFEYRQLHKFTIISGLLLLFIGSLLAFTPIFDFLLNTIMRLPLNISYSIKIAYKYLLPWPLIIAWRRFNQGKLIFTGNSKIVSLGTVLRLFTGGAVALIVLHYWGIPGAIAGAISLIAAVFVESLFIFGAIKAKASVFTKLNDNDLLSSTNFFSLWGLAKFYLPLSITTIMAYSVSPFMYVSLGRLNYPIESLAAWPIIFGLVILLSSFGQAIQEPVITVHNKDKNNVALKRIAFLGGFLFSTIILFLALTEFGELYLIHVAGLPTNLKHLVACSLLISIPIPLLVTSEFYLRGILIAEGNSKRVSIGMCIFWITLITIILVGILRNETGIFIGLLSFAVSISIEVIYLWRMTQRKTL